MTSVSSFISQWSFSSVSLHEPAAVVMRCVLSRMSHFSHWFVRHEDCVKTPSRNLSAPVQGEKKSSHFLQVTSGRVCLSLIRVHEFILRLFRSQVNSTHLNRNRWFSQPIKAHFTYAAHRCCLYLSNTMVSRASLSSVAFWHEGLPRRWAWFQCSL